MRGNVGHNVSTHRGGAVNVYDLAIRRVAAYEEVPTVEKRVSRLQKQTFRLQQYTSDSDTHVGLGHLPRRLWARTSGRSGATA